MPLQDIATVTISLDSGGISRPSFGVPIFFAAHNYSTNRVDSFSTLAEVAALFGTTANAYKAAQSVFGNSPSVPTFKIARIVGNTDLTPTITTVGTVYTVTVTDQAGVSVTASATMDGVTNTTASQIIDELVADINAGTQNVLATDNNSYLTLSRESGTYPTIDFKISNVSNLTVAESSAGSESISTAYNNLKLVDNDWYAVGWEDHTDKTNILALAALVEADVKLYFYGSSAVESIDDTYVEGTDPDNLDIIAWLSEGNYFRTVTWWHQDADTTFNEMAYCGYNLPYDAGTVVWTNNQLSGVEAAKNPSGVALTTTQQNNLNDRKCTFLATKGGIAHTRGGKVAGGEWIDNIHGRDNLQSDMELDLFDLLTNQQGRKLPYTDKGINVVAGVVESRLNYYKNVRGFLTDPIKINVPKAKDVLRADKVARVLNDLTFTAKLAGAIIMTDITGILEV